MGNRTYVLLSKWQYVCAAPILALAFSSRLEAQSRERFTLAGVVTDTTGVPLNGVEVQIGALKRKVFSDSAGVFRFRDVKPGSYTVAARRIGFFPQTQDVVVPDSGAILRFGLVPYVYSLSPVVSAAVRSGLSGVVGDTTYRSIEGAEVAALATDKRAQTDSVGSFYLPLGPGQYVVRVTGAGFSIRLISVTIPRDSGRRLVVWMTPTTGSSAREFANIFDLNSRLLRRGPMSKLYTREDIVHMNPTDLRQLLVVGSGGPVRDDCRAIIDGGPSTAPVWAIALEDIEMVEIHQLTVPGAIVRGRAGASRPPSGCSATIYVWLRK